MTKLTPAQRRERLRQSLRQAKTPEDVEEEYVRAIFMIEKELGHFIDYKYPLMKFWEEVETYQWYKEEEEKNYNG